MGYIKVGVIVCFYLYSTPWPRVSFQFLNVQAVAEKEKQLTQLLEQQVEVLKQQTLVVRAMLDGDGMMITIYMYPLHTTPLYTPLPSTDCPLHTTPSTHHSPLHTTPLYTPLPSTHHSPLHITPLPSPPLMVTLF